MSHDFSCRAYKIKDEWKSLWAAQNDIRYRKQRRRCWISLCTAWSDQQEAAVPPDTGADRVSWGAARLFGVRRELTSLLTAMAQCHHWGSAPDCLSFHLILFNNAPGWLGKDWYHWCINTSITAVIILHFLRTDANQLKRGSCCIDVKCRFNAGYHQVLLNYVVIIVHVSRVNINMCLYLARLFARGKYTRLVETCSHKQPSTCLFVLKSISACSWFAQNTSSANKSIDRYTGCTVMTLRTIKWQAKLYAWVTQRRSNPFLPQIVLISE